MGRKGANGVDYVGPEMPSEVPMHRGELDTIVGPSLAEALTSETAAGEYVQEQLKEFLEKDDSKEPKRSKK